ncbi:hypothetical protein BDV12DRAFT_76802 [Aspergillus spectabilis]
MGYASFLTDDRSGVWWRVYAGQCTSSRRRSSAQHTKNVLRHSVASVHYYIIWLGDGHRCPPMGISQPY